MFKKKVIAMVRKGCLSRVAAALLLGLLLGGGCAAYGQPSKVMLGSGSSMPPYVIPDKGRGIALDVFRAAMAASNIQVDTMYANNAEVVQAFNEQRVDAVFVTNPKLTPDAHFSRLPLAVFHNLAISLHDENIDVQQIGELSNYRLGAFKLASKLMPSPFPETVSQTADYREYSLQLEQVEDLYRGDRQVLVMDKTIFRYFLSQMKRKNPRSPSYRRAVHFNDLFAKRRYHAAFRSEEMRDKFDQGFDAIRENGRYERILRTYENLLANYLVR